jgi:hypothetical protein
MENMFDEKFINMYKQQITNLWEKEYKSIQPEVFNPPEESNILANHMFKKRKFIQTDELDNYLNSPIIDYNTDVLQYWKVSIIYY